MIYSEQSWLDFMGVQAARSWYGNEYRKTSNLLAKYRMVGFALLCAALKTCRFPVLSLGLKPLADGISLKNIIHEDSEIMTACKHGDLKIVRQLSESRQASLNNVTPLNSPPLRYATEKGNSDVVRTILAVGADANKIFGECTTSPLQWAFESRKMNFARLFVEHGAQVDHIDAHGWTPAFRLFGYGWIHHSTGPCRGYLELLSAKGFSEFDIKGVANWSVIHRAAAYGTADDTSALIQRGSSAEWLTIMNWKPIRCALVFGNVDTFLELAKHMQPSFVDDQDIRGWTLLHQAADRASSIILDLVLSYRADPHILSLATSYGVPESLEYQAVSVAKVTKHKGIEAYAVYVKALDNVGLDLIVQEDPDVLNVGVAS